MKETIDKEVLRTSLDRSTIYSFLRMALQEPLEKGALQNWKDHLTKDVVDALTEENHYLQSFFNDLNKVCLEDVVASETAAYMATFNVFNESGKIPAPPWESVYVSKDHSMFGDSAVELREKLDEFGLKVINENREPEDHIATELEFMNYLITYTYEAGLSGERELYEKGILDQYWLHTEHLDKWIDAFTDDILNSNTTPFYKGIAVLLRWFVKEDYMFIKSIKEDFKNEG